MDAKGGIMIGMVSGWLLSKGLGINMQKILGIGLAVILLAGVVMKIRADGIRAGEQRAKIEEVERELVDQEKEQLQLVAAIRQQTAVIEEGKAREQLHIEERAEWQRALQENARMFASLQQQRQDVSQQIGRITDSDLAFTIKKTLGMRHPDAYAIPGYAPLEERAMLQCLMDYPLCEKENNLLGEKVTALEGEVKTFGGQVEAIHQQVKGLETIVLAHRSYEQQLEGHYETAVNALGRKRRSAKCLFLWKCSKKTLTVPVLSELLKVKPGEIQ